MKFRSLLLCVVALALAVAAQAQDLKPVKDRDSKKFGYQDKSKNWVIEPRFDKANRFIDGFAIVEVGGLKGLIDQDGNWTLQPDYQNIGKFDKNGLCELTVKDGRQKLHGLADMSGHLVLPPDCKSISISRADQLIMAQRLESLGGDESDWLWGVYDMTGDEIFAPWFTDMPHFHKGMASARAADTGLVGLINDRSEVLLPFCNLAVSCGYSGIEVLTSDFTILNYDSALRLTSEMRSPGSVIPYDPMDDDVRLAAWHSGCIGRRLHPNNVKAVQIARDSYGYAAICSELPMDWGYGRFIRLEPEIDTLGRPGSVPNPNNGQLYTLRALMFESDGRYVGVVSDWGQLEAVCREGYIYSSEGEQKWLVFNDINYPARIRGSVGLHEFRNIDNYDVVSAFELGTYDLARLAKCSYRTRRVKEIIEGDNVGVTSYLPRRMPDHRAARAMENAMKARCFRRPYRMGEVVNCRTWSAGEKIEIELSDNLVCRFEDRFDNPYYSMNGEEEIWWGPNGARTVGLSLEADERNSGMIEDDIHGSGYRFKVLINMYEEDGRFLRTLAEAPMIDFMDQGVIVFERLGIAIIDDGHRPGSHSGHHDAYGHGTPRRLTLDKASRLEPKLSALNGKENKVPAGPPKAGAAPRGHTRPN